VRRPATGACPRAAVTAALSALAGLLAAPGCATGFLRPRSSAGLPSRAAPTVGGGLLEARDGDLYVLPARDDLGAALGVGLEDDPAGGVRVTNRLRPGTELAPGDRIVAAAAWPGRADAEIGAAEVAWLVGIQPSTAGTGAVPSAPAAVPAKAPLALGPRDIRAAAGGHEVRTLADLHGYGAARGWARLHLGVVRGGRPTWVAARLASPREPVPVERAPDARAMFTRFGYELAPVASLSPEHRPAAAAPDDRIVLFVAQGSPAAVAGLRPLDLCTEEAAQALARGGDERVELRAGDGSTKAIRPDWPEEPIDVWIPLLVSYQWDGARRHVGIGPLDLLVHFVTDNVYDAEEDEHARVWRTSVLGIFQRERERRRTGTAATTVALNPLVDLARLRYFVEWWTGEPPP
jgi:hypothetical protein